MAGPVPDPQATIQEKDLAKLQKVLAAEREKNKTLKKDLDKFRSIAAEWTVVNPRTGRTKDADVKAELAHLREEVTQLERALAVSRDETRALQETLARSTDDAEKLRPAVPNTGPLTDPALELEDIRPVDAQVANIIDSVEEAPPMTALDSSTPLPGSSRSSTTIDLTTPPPQTAPARKRKRDYAWLGENNHMAKKARPAPYKAPPPAESSDDDDDVVVFHGRTATSLKGHLNPSEARGDGVALGVTLSVDKTPNVSDEEFSALIEAELVNAMSSYDDRQDGPVGVDAL
ncbi:MAG: hypothetical protein M1838_003568 [Thelocarpon superellum]|nr:MAG: hypothetical protein M1838_003568 [Thelocarpon superellum]